MNMHFKILITSTFSSGSGIFSQMDRKMSRIFAWSSEWPIKLNFAAKILSSITNSGLLVAYDFMLSFSQFSSAATMFQGLISSILISRFFSSISWKDPSTRGGSSQTRLGALFLEEVSKPFSNIFLREEVTCLIQFRCVSMLLGSMSYSIFKKHIETQISIFFIF